MLGKAPQTMCQRGMAGLGEFARKNPRGRTQGQCWLQSSVTACASPSPHARHSSGSQGRHRAGTAAEQQRQQPKLWGLQAPWAAPALLALEGTR